MYGRSRHCVCLCVTACVYVQPNVGCPLSSFAGVWRLRVRTHTFLRCTRNAAAESVHQKHTEAVEGKNPPPPTPLHTHTHTEAMSKSGSFSHSRTIAAMPCQGTTNRRETNRAWSTGWANRVARGSSRACRTPPANRSLCLRTPPLPPSYPVAGFLCNPMHFPGKLFHNGGWDGDGEMLREVA